MVRLVLDRGDVGSWGCEGTGCGVRGAGVGLKMRNSDCSLRGYGGYCGCGLQMWGAGCVECEVWHVSFDVRRAGVSTTVRVVFAMGMCLPCCDVAQTSRIAFPFGA